jgi:hypothetical protein
MYIHIHIPVCIYMHVYTYVCMYIHIYVLYVYTYYFAVYLYVCIHTLAEIWIMCLSSMLPFVYCNRSVFHIPPYPHKPMYFFMWTCCFQLMFLHLTHVCMYLTIYFIHFLSRIVHEQMDICIYVYVCVLIHKYVSMYVYIYL